MSSFFPRELRFCFVLSQGPMYPRLVFNLLCIWWPWTSDPLALPSKCTHYHAQFILYWGIKLRASWMLGKHSANWPIASALSGEFSKSQQGERKDPSTKPMYYCEEDCEAEAGIVSMHSISSCDKAGPHLRNENDTTVMAFSSEVKQRFYSL